MIEGLDRGSLGTCIIKCQLEGVTKVLLCKPIQKAVHGINHKLMGWIPVWQTLQL